MPFAAFVLISLCFLLTLAAAVPSLLLLRSDNHAPLVWIERANHALFLTMTAAGALLTLALYRNDFSFFYVMQHTDRDLHLFYRLTAFWAGQEGALLFWAWCAVLCALCFQRAKGYARLRSGTKLWYWALYFVILGFFCLLLITWNNPFLTAAPVPDDGMGLNPLLQNPGMIFHPPLLFLGYGAFTIPCCLCLAQSLSGAGGPEERWARLTRPFILIGWLTLGAGIILGGWWSYMELGWGGYWGWDPVENSSLVPWLVATAYLHTALIEEQRDKLPRVNVFLMALITISAFFATYIVRGGVVNSLHAFGESPVGTPLLLFVLSFLAFAAFVSLRAPRTGAPLADPFSREGALVCVCWIFLALSVIILLGTLWPVISKLWSDKAQGFGPGFFNTVCLPLVAALALLLAACPWLDWNGGLRHKPQACIVLGMAVLSGVMLAVMGLTKPLALIAAASAIGIAATLCLTFAVRPGLFRLAQTLAAHGAHFGFALMVLGVAFSGPYKMEEKFTLKPGQGAMFGEYAIQLTGVRGGDDHDLEPGAKPGQAHDHTQTPRFIFSEASVRVLKNNRELGVMRPQMRKYPSRPDSVFSEVDTLFSWGNEVYCNMTSVTEDGTVTMQISLNPLVNWIWLGGILLCLFPLLGLRPRRGKAEE